MNSTVLDPAPTVPQSQVTELLVLWQHPENRRIFVVGRMSHVDDEFRFAYTRAAAQIEGFRPLLGYPALYDSYSTTQVPLLLRQRVMLPTRPGFAHYMDVLGLSLDATPWEQVVASGGDRVGDTLQFMCMPRVGQGHVHAQFLCNGIRHVPHHKAVVGGCPLTVTQERHEEVLKSLRPGSRLRMEPEEQNPHDPDAVLLLHGDALVGWLPRILAPGARQLIASGVTEVTVQRVAPPDAPPHVRLVLEFNAPVPPGFTFDPRNDWAPLAQEREKVGAGRA